MLQKKKLSKLYYNKQAKSKGNKRKKQYIYVWKKFAWK